MSSSITLDSQLTYIKGIGPVLGQALASLGIITVKDLIYYAPRRYEDFSNLVEIKDFRPGLISTKLIINNVVGRYVRNGLHITEALGSDETGSVKLIWFNQPYRQKSIKTGVNYYVSGKFELSSRRFSIMNPALELESDFPIVTNAILPVYKVNKNISVNQIRRSIRNVFNQVDQIEDFMPSDLIKKTKIENLTTALRNLHFPESIEDLDKAKYRLSFDEIFSLTLVSLKNRDLLKKNHSSIVEFNSALAQKFVGLLPFKLTNSQREVIWRIYQDLEHDLPMNRLLEGDVGSGKTVVALMAALMVMNKKWQTVFLAPTEVLARQHYETITKLLAQLNLESKVDLLVGSMTKKQKELVKDRLKSNEILLVVGTHALLEEDVKLNNLAFLIVDEQHRFGVEQRKKLQVNSTKIPHLLTLSATPIPRSLALTFFGELSISRLSEKPNETTQVETKVVSETNINSVYDVIKKEMTLGHQVFVVCPLIIKSNIGQSKNDVNSIYNELTRLFPKFRLGLMHGKLPAKEKEAVMRQFVRHELDLIVSTTVIEVGVDVPNATVMAIFNSDSFGLAQLHQLRGRIGRSDLKSYCFFIGDDDITKNERIKSLVKLNNGFELAEIDLKMRGPGAFFGLSQHGLTDLKFVEFSDLSFIRSVKAVAQQFFETGELQKYKQLNNKVNQLSSIKTLD